MQSLYKHFKNVNNLVLDMVKNREIYDVGYKVYEEEDKYIVDLCLELSKSELPSDEDSNIDYSEVNQKITKDRLKEIVEEIKNKPKAEVFFDNKGVTISDKGVHINGGSARW